MTLGRRSFLRLALLSGLFSLSGCSFGTLRPTLFFAKGVLPKEFLQTLPSRWEYQFSNVRSGRDFCVSEQAIKADLVALGDGWLKTCSPELFQTIGVDGLYDHLNNQAIAFLNGLGPIFLEKVFPVAFSPWVLIFRRGEEFLARANESWEILLDPKLRGHVILPDSPRLIMSLAERMSHEDSLRRLILQARSFDDRNGLNWLLSGKAKVAILPLQYCLKNLTRDPRLSIALPKEGCPLNWTLLLRPKSTNELFPSSSIKQSLSLPTLVNLLAIGLIPPLPYSELIESIDALPDNYQLIYASETMFDNAWSLPILTPLEEQVLQEKWMNSTP